MENLIGELNLDYEKLNNFFKEYNLVCEKNKFLSEIVKTRNEIVHGNAVVSEKLNLLMSTFVNILSLKLFNIDCAIYIPLIEHNVFTGEFVNQFTSSNEKNNVESNREIKDNIIEVIDIDGELFLSLAIFDDLIDNGDKFRLLEFETKEYGDDCKLNLKMSRFVKN